MRHPRDCVASRSHFGASWSRGTPVPSSGTCAESGFSDSARRLTEVRVPSCLVRTRPSVPASTPPPEFPYMAARCAATRPEAALHSPPEQARTHVAHFGAIAVDGSDSWGHPLGGLDEAI